MNLEGFERSEFLRLSWQKPIMAQIELTRDCNQKCLFCFGACCPEAKCVTLSVDQWKTIILKLKRLGVRRLNFSGGENFLYPGFAEIIAFSKTQGFVVIVNTNGTFSCRGIVSSTDDVIFSIHGLEQMHDRITKNPGAFSTACRHIGEIAGLVRVSVNMVLIKDNYGEMNDVFELIDRLYGIHKFSPSLSVKSRFGSNHDEYALDITPELFADYRERLQRIPVQKLEMKHGLRSIYLNDRAIYTKQGFPLPDCAAGKYKLVIDYDGDVYPCYFFRGPEFFCGNILSGNETDIWENGRGFNLFRDLVLQEAIPAKCKGCLKKHRCFSGCGAWTNEYQKGGFGNAADIRCEAGNAFVGG